MPEPEDPGRRATRAWIVSSLITAPLTPLNSTMIAVALPAIATAFGVKSIPT